MLIVCIAPQVLSCDTLYVFIEQNFKSWFFLLKWGVFLIAKCLLVLGRLIVGVFSNTVGSLTYSIKSFEVNFVGNYP